MADKKIYAGIAFYHISIVSFKFLCKSIGKMFFIIRVSEKIAACKSEWKMSKNEMMLVLNHNLKL